MKGNPRYSLASLPKGRRILGTLKNVSVPPGYLSAPQYVKIWIEEDHTDQWGTWWYKNSARYTCTGEIALWSACNECPKYPWICTQDDWCRSDWPGCGREWLNARCYSAIGCAITRKDHSGRAYCEEGFYDDRTPDEIEMGCCVPIERPCVAVDHFSVTPTMNLNSGQVSIRGNISANNLETGINWKLMLNGNIIQEGWGNTVAVAWDGKDASGKQVAPGRYMVSLEAQSFNCEGGDLKTSQSTPITVSVSDQDPCALQVTVGSSVNIANGNLYNPQTLFQIPNSKLMKEFTLSYNSLNGQETPLGTGWSHTFNIRLSPNNDDSYTLTEGHGRKIVLYSKGDHYTPKTLNYPILTINGDGTATLEKKEGIFYRFDNKGNITSINDRNDNAISLAYDSNSNLASITDPSGRKIFLAYDAVNRISTITDPQANIHSFSYTDKDLTGISSQIQRLGVQNWSYSYVKGFMATKTDPMGNTTYYEYNNDHRVGYVRDPEWKSRSISYNAEYSLVFEKDGGLWTYKYDPSLGVLKEKVDPLGKSWVYTYYPDGNLKSVTDPRGYTTSYAYDRNGNVTSVEDALGHVIRYTHNSFNKVATIEMDPREPLITFSYDERGNLAKVVDQMGVATEYSYDAKGNLIAVKNPLQEIGFEYNPQSYLIGVKDLGMGLSLYEYGYDDAGNQTWVKEVQKGEEGEPEKVIRYEYNGLSKITQVTGPAPELFMTYYDYDPSGNIRSIIDGNGNQTAYEYNYRGQVTKVTDALGNITEFQYGTGCSACGSGVDRLTSVTDGKKQTTTLEYDQAGNLVRGISPMGFITSYEYDPAGNLYSRTDANGNTTRYVFDELNRLREIQYPDQTKVSFAYDYRGNVKAAANPHISYSFIHDLNNRLLSAMDSEGKSFSYEYNAIGNRVRIVRPDQRVVEYRYDLGNYLSQMLVDSVPYFSFTHDFYGRRLSLGYPNGIRTRYAYTSSGYLRELTYESSTLVNSFVYTYDAVGNRRTMTDLSGIHEYEYDKIYQLIKAIHPAMPKEQYKYDAAGNRLNKDVDADNRLLEDNGFTYEYDNNGNIIRKTNKKTGETKTFSYDWENRLIRVESPDKVIHYRYDPFGQRIEMEVNGKVSRYVYDIANINLEYGPKGNIKSRFVHSLGIDEPLLLVRGKHKYYYHADGLGSITDLTDDSGAVVKSYQYKSFGRVYSQTGDLAQPFKFTGREWDPGSGLYFYRARYYNPRSGRFLTKDPIGFAGGDVNLYRYVQNNPQNRIDLDGLFGPFGPGFSNLRPVNQYKPNPGDISMSVKERTMLEMMSPNRGRALPGQFGKAGLEGACEGGKVLAPIILEDLLLPYLKVIKYRGPITDYFENTNPFDPRPAGASVIGIGEK